MNYEVGLNAVQTKAKRINVRLLCDRPPGGTERHHAALTCLNPTYASCKYLSGSDITRTTNPVKSMRIILNYFLNSLIQNSKLKTQNSKLKTINVTV
jgi:hypothetical protein